MMGYVHRWTRPRAISEETFGRIAGDLRHLLPLFEEHGIKLADGHGEGLPVVDDEEIWFNGARACGHPADSQIRLPWPANGAGGIRSAGEDVVRGRWCAGVLVSKRCCNGDCSYESFYFPRVAEPPERITPGGGSSCSDCCKTSFRPYDVAVTAALVIAKRHLGDRLVVNSDGDLDHWFDGMLACQTVLGYGLEFKLDP